MRAQYIKICIGEGYAVCKRVTVVAARRKGVAKDAYAQIVKVKASKLLRRKDENVFRERSVGICAALDVGVVISGAYNDGSSRRGKRLKDSTPRACGAERAVEDISRMSLQSKVLQCFPVCCTVTSQSRPVFAL